MNADVFAWFNATSQISVSSVSTDDTIKAVDSTLGGLGIKVTWADIANADKLVLTRESGGNLKTYVINSAGVLVEGSQGSNLLYLTATATLSPADGKTWADYKSYAGTYTAHIQLTQDRTSTHSGDPILYISASAAADSWVDVAAGTSINWEFTIPANTGEPAVKTKSVYIRADGGTGTVGGTDGQVHNEGNGPVTVSASVGTVSETLTGAA